MSVGGSLLDLAPASSPHVGLQEPLSRIEAKQARRQNRRKSRRQRFAPVIAVRDRAQRASSAAARRAAGVRRRALESAASLPRRTSGVARHTKQKVRQLALQMQRRADASRAQMMAERETMKSLTRRGVVALAQTTANATHRSKDVAINLAKRSADAIRDGGRASQVRGREICRWATASSGEIGLLFAAARKRLHGGSVVIAAAAAHLSGRTRDAARHLSQRIAPLLRDGSRAVARPFVEPALERQEFNGFVVAVLLAVVVVGYGGFLAVFLRTPTDARVTQVAALQPLGEAKVMTALASPGMGERSAVRAASPPAVVRTAATDIARRAPAAPTARTLTALWQRRDTRSLDRAFATLRGETLAFRRCGMRMTDADRAVARCEGIVTTRTADGAPSSRAAMWTIDFRRTGGRWLIARVSTR
jgi:ketosteroid isomerase-like protein